MNALPPDDSGRDAFERFRFQAHLAFRSCLNCVTDNGVEVVVCEHFEDLCVVERDRVVFAQVKTRDATYGPWKLKDLTGGSGALKSLLRTHRALVGVDVGGREIAYEILLEGALARNDGIQDLATGSARASDDLVATVVRGLGVKPAITWEEAREVLARTRVKAAPLRESVADLNRSLLGTMAGDLPYNTLAETYDNVIARIAEAMAGGISPTWPTSLFTAEQRLDVTAAAIAAKRLDKPRLEHQFQPVLAAAADAVRVMAVEERYRRAVERRSSTIDLGTLGAGIPPIPVEQLDIVVNGLPVWTRTRTAHPLAWLARRAKRSVLVGPPGCGKTVAARRIAGFYAEREEWPLPLFVSLPRILERRRHVGDLDAIVAAAIEDEPAADREVLKRLAHDALTEGRALLVFDALDETRRERRGVVASINKIMSAVHDDVEVVLTTREVAYADAAGLSFKEIEVAPPALPMRTIDTVLSALADRDAVRQQERPTWAAPRRRWILDRLAEDEQLAATPLSVVLLALLAGRSSLDQLPRHRAGVLTSVVRDVITRRADAERAAGEGLMIGRLAAGEATDACWIAFVHIGHHVVEAGRPTAESAVETLASVLGAGFGLAPAPAERAARDAVAFWDEQGVFVKSSDEVLVARVRSLAELADAWFAVRLGTEDSRRAWVRAALDQNLGREQLRMASVLSTEIADALTLEVAERWPGAQLHELSASCRAGARPTDRAIEQLVRVILDGAPLGWSHAVALATLPVPPEHQGRAASLFSAQDGFLGLFLEAASAISWQLQERDDVLRAFLLADRSEEAQSTVVWPQGRHWRLLHHEIFMLAAERLVQRDDTELPQALLRTASLASTLWSFRGLRTLLRARGFEQLVLDFAKREEGLEPAFNEDLTMQKLLEVEAEIAERLDAAIAAASEHHVGTADEAVARRVTEVAALFSTLHRLGSRGSLLEVREAEDLLPRLFDAVIRLAGLDASILETQLAELDRIGTTDGRAARLAMVDGEPPLEDLRWPDGPEADQLRKHLAELARSSVPWVADAAAGLLTTM